MKNNILLLCMIFTLTSLSVQGQGYKINFSHDKTEHDSLYFQKYNGTTFVTQQRIANSPTVVFKGKEMLTPGMYQITGDSVTLAEIIISSSEKIDRLSISVSGEDIVFENNPENAAYVAYIKEMYQYRKIMGEYEKEFQDLQKSSMPDYMKQNMADNIMGKAQATELAHKTYQEDLIKTHEGNLLASIVKAGLEIPPPPQNFYQNRMLLYSYFAEHTFDSYPFEDERLLYTQMTSDKIKEYAGLLYEFENEDGAPYLKMLLKKMRISPKTYYLFFDQLEKVLGSIYSPYRSEDLYIIMLQDALTLPELEEARKVRYTRELSLININLRGSQLPDFEIMLANDSITSLHKIQCNYMIIYFQNPDCPTCISVREAMSKMPTLIQAVNNGKVKVLTVYFEDNEKLWRKYLKEAANPSYLNGWNYTHNLEQDNLFDLRTIPYLFLVDKDKRVIKKDLLINEIEYYIRNLK